MRASATEEVCIAIGWIYAGEPMRESYHALCKLQVGSTLDNDIVYLSPRCRYYVLY